MTTTDQLPARRPAQDRAAGTRRSRFNRRRVGCLDPRRPGSSSSPCSPFYWMLRTALSNNASLAANAGKPAAGRLHPRAPSSGCSACRPPRRPRPRAAPAPRSTSGCTCGTRSSSPSLITARAGRSSARWPPTPSPGCAGRAATWCSALFLATLMVPPIFTALPNFLLIKNLGPAQHPARHRPAVPVHDPLRDLLPAPVLPRHLPGSRGGRHASTAPSTSGSSSRSSLPMTPPPRSPPWPS